MSVGDAAAGRLHNAFDYTDNNCVVERGGDENGGVREGELVEVRWR